MDRAALRTTVGLLTGHCPLGSHARRMGLNTSDTCHLCGDEDEILDATHILCHCPALARRSLKHLGFAYLTNLNEVSQIEAHKIGRFSKIVDDITVQRIEETNSGLASRLPTMHMGDTA